MVSAFGTSWKSGTGYCVSNAITLLTQLSIRWAGGAGSHNSKPTVLPVLTFYPIHCNQLYFTTTTAQLIHQQVFVGAKFIQLDHMYSPTFRWLSLTSVLSPNMADIGTVLHAINQCVFGINNFMVTKCSWVANCCLAKVSAQACCNPSQLAAATYVIQGVASVIRIQRHQFMCIWILEEASN